MTVIALLLLSAALYGFAYARVRAAHRPFPPASVASFTVGLVAIGAVLIGPIDTLADRSLAWHMLQHLVLISLAAPLLLFGAPIRLALAALPMRRAASLAGLLNSSVVRFIDHPAFGFGLLTVVLYGTHFSPLYEFALDHPPAHAGEHALYLLAGVVYWSPIFAVAPAPHAAAHPARILALFLTLPMSAFLGFAFYVTQRVIYPHYAMQPNALVDQMNAGAVMWLSAGTPALGALLWCVADWGVKERRLGELLDASEEGS